MYPVLRKLLREIEESHFKNITVSEAARKQRLSPSHLRRLFKDAFGVPLAGYMRSRRLQLSLEKLLCADAGLADIAAEYGFDYAQSYIRAFKREFGLTPGEARGSGNIIEVRPPLQWPSRGEIADGAPFGPEIVYTPEILCVGKPRLLPCRDYGEMMESYAREFSKFWLSEKDEIPSAEGQAVYINLTNILEGASGRSLIHTPSVCVADFCDVPYGFERKVIPPSLCVRFRYAGEHHYMDINGELAHGLYSALKAFHGDKNATYSPFHRGTYFERIVPQASGGAYCKTEFYSPVRAAGKKPEWYFPDCGRSAY